MRRRYSPDNLLRSTILAVLAVSLAGCSISTQLGPIFGSRDEPATTGSIAPNDGRFSAEMTDTDWQQANAALQMALAPEAAGRSSQWTNSDTGRKGSVTAVSEARTEQDRTCRAFLATLGEGAGTRWFQGQACGSSGQAWEVVSSNAWTPPTR